MPYFVNADKDWALGAPRWPACKAYLDRNLARPGVAAVLDLAWIEDTSAWLKA